MDINKALSEFNNIHRKIQFSMEEENNKQINFLYLSITKTHNSLQVGIFRKPTATDIMIHNTSCYPTEHETAGISYLINRAITYPISEYNINRAITYPLSEDSINRAITYPISEDSINRAITYPLSEDSINRAITYSLSEDSINRAITYPISEDSINRAITYPISEDSINKEKQTIDHLLKVNGYHRLNASELIQHRKQHTGKDHKQNQKK
jgi:hypothetical protein